MTERKTKPEFGNLYIKSRTSNIERAFIFFEPLYFFVTFGVTTEIQNKNEKQVACYVNLDGVETFSDT